MASTTIWIALVGLFVAVVLVFVQGDSVGYRRRDRASVSRCPNPRLHFRNGVAKLRFRGRVAKYICLPGFTLIGDPVATCYAGRWDRPVPICAAPGCRIPSRDLLARGTVENFRNRGVMLLFRCRAGYALHGSTKAYCDGRSWNTSLPRCLPLVANPELSCDFEDPDLCGWTADLTRSNQFARAHLTDDEERRSDNDSASSHGHFMTVQYIGHPGLVEDVFPVARLTSPVFRPMTSKSCFRFWYKLPCSLCSLRLLIWTSDTLTPVWSTYGPREPSWVNVRLNPVSEDFQLVFEARPSRKDITGLVIDDVRLELSECHLALSTEEVPTTTVADSAQNETSTDKGDFGGVSDTIPLETVFTIAPPDSNASKLSSAMGSSTTQSSSPQVTMQTSAAVPNDTAEDTVGTTLTPADENGTVRAPFRETTALPTLSPQISTGPVTRARVTVTTLTSVPNETTTPYTRSTSQSALTEPSPTVVTSATTTRPALRTDMSRTSSTRPWSVVTSSALSTEQTNVTNGAQRSSSRTDINGTSYPPGVSTSSSSTLRAVTRYNTTTTPLAPTTQTAITTIPRATVSSGPSTRVQTVTSRPSSTATTVRTSSLTTLPSPRQTSSVKSNPTKIPPVTRSTAPSTSPRPATARTTSAWTMYTTYTTGRPTTPTTTSAATVYARPTRQRVTLYPLYTRYTRNTRYPLRNRTVSYVPTNQVTRVRSTAATTRPSSARPGTVSRTRVVTARPTTGRLSTEVQRTTRRTYTTAVQGATRAPRVLQVTTRQNLGAGYFGTTAKTITINTNFSTPENSTSSHRTRTTEGTKPAGISARTTPWLVTKPTKPTRKTAKPYHGNDFTKWTKKTTVKTTAHMVTTLKPPTTSRVSVSTSEEWLGEDYDFPSESPSRFTSDEIPGASDAPEDVEDNEIPLLNDGPVRNHAYVAKPQQSASVGEKGSSWGLLALKIGMATASALALALLVMFAMLRCKKRTRSGLGDDSEMRPLSQFEQSDAADGAS